ncbi:MAG TPA: bifunctional diaminohydroxyphosphoribosylaminopyrimidine deaminase/5-amino-6-(5-phosphoribosylamino)uracil reductase RibD [Cytophagales bacterium]|nr:bifunctional diaminohydroxyphosphoribosylaminopyrimidine deaminase/5-amino-6-(5-phosphoribosylamino)uracil reductase RibD [Cytophagales bacterium]
MEEYSIYMKRALELAGYGRGKVSPNPMVGCVIVHKDKIIGEGWHKSYGDPHAEVNAVDDVEDKSLLNESTLVVTLEPCSHWGKTPPCADLIIKHKIPKVVICNVDSNPLVGGKGIIKLKEAGTEVISGVMETEGRDLNKRFFNFLENKRPFIILKWAETSDGFIAREDFSSKWISNELSRKLVHKWRAEEDSIMVGTKTAFYDNPQLNVRHWVGSSPIRIVIDRNLSLPKTLNIFDTSQTTLCYNSTRDESQEYNQYIKLDYSLPVLPQILEDLYRRQIQSVIVEGGAKLMDEFMKINMWDEIRCFRSKAVFGKGIKAPQIEGVLISEEKILDNTLKIYRPKI